MHFLESKAAYRDGRALVFHNIDYLMMTFKLMRKDYMYLAACLVPMGDQIGMSQRELADMLRTKTRRFTEEEIEAKFKKTVTAAERKKGVDVSGVQVSGVESGEAEKVAEVEVGGCRNRKV